MKCRSHAPTGRSRRPFHPAAAGGQFHGSPRWHQVVPPRRMECNRISNRPQPSSLPSCRSWRPISWKSPMAPVAPPRRMECRSYAPTGRSRRPFHPAAAGGQFHERSAGWHQMVPPRRMKCRSYAPTGRSRRPFHPAAAGGPISEKSEVHTGPSRQLYDRPISGFLAEYPERPAAALRVARQPNPVRRNGAAGTMRDRSGAHSTMLDKPQCACYARYHSGSTIN